MVCAYCANRIVEEPIRVVGEYYCSTGCVNMANDLDADDCEGYYEESELEGLYEEDE